MIQEHTGIPLSPYYSAAKIAWVLRNVEEARQSGGSRESWRWEPWTATSLYRLTPEHVL